MTQDEIDAEVRAIIETAPGSLEPDRQSGRGCDPDGAASPAICWAFLMRKLPK